jgi:integrase
MAERRSTGEGTVRKLADGTWWGQTSLGYEVSYDERGQPLKRRRIRRSVRGRNRAEVVDKLKALRAQGKGQRGAAGRTVEAFLTDWLKRTRLRVRPSTWESYESYVTTHLSPTLGHLRLEQLTAEHVQKLCLGVHKRGLSPRTVAKVRAVLRNALNDAKRDRLVAYNAAEYVDLPRVESSAVPAMTPADAVAVLAAVRNHRIAPMVEVALATGLRQGELLGLSWQDVDLDAGRITVRRALQRVNGKRVLVEPKTRKSRRTLPLTAAAVEALRTLRQSQFVITLPAIADAQPFSDLVFRTPHGDPIDAKELTHTFQRLLAAAELPKMRWHDLRHGTASLLIAQGVDLRVVMEVLGHSTITLTANTYAHVSDALLDTARDALDRALPARDVTHRAV